MQLAQLHVSSIYKLAMLSGLKDGGMIMIVTSDSLFSSTLTHRRTFKEGMTAELSPIHGDQSCNMQVNKMLLALNHVQIVL